MKSFFINVISFAIVLFISSCSDPMDYMDVKVPADSKSRESDKKFFAAYKRLSDSERLLLIDYLTRMIVQSKSFDGNLNIDITIREAIENQRQFVENSRKEQEHEEALAKKTASEQEAVKKEMNKALVVSLVKLSYVDANYESGVYQDYFNIKLSFKNNTKKDISGIKGKAIFKNIFNEEVKRVNIYSDNSIKASSTFIYQGSLKFDRFSKSDIMLRSTTKIIFEWIPIAYIFEDGSSLSVSD